MGPTLRDLPPTDTIQSGDIEVRWQRDAAYAELRCLAPVVADEAAARELVPAVREWFEGVDGTLRVLVDCHQMRGSDAAWRSRFFGLFVGERRRLRVAWVNMNSTIRIIVLMFLTALRTGGVFDGRTFTDVDEALAWLAEDEG
jgi:hypothetical protein